MAERPRKTFLPRTTLRRTALVDDPTLPSRDKASATVVLLSIRLSERCLPKETSSASGPLVTCAIRTYPEKKQEKIVRQVRRSTFLSCLGHVTCGIPRQSDRSTTFRGVCNLGLSYDSRVTMRSIATRLFAATLLLVLLGTLSQRAICEIQCSLAHDSHAAHASHAAMRNMPGHMAMDATGTISSVTAAPSATQRCAPLVNCQAGCSVALTAVLTQAHSSLSQLHAVVRSQRLQPGLFSVRPCSLITGKDPPPPNRQLDPILLSLRV